MVNGRILQTPTSVIKRNLLEAFKEWEEDPAGERISSANIIESKRTSLTNVQIEKEKLINWINMQNDRTPVTPTAPTLIIKKDQWGETKEW